MLYTTLMELIFS